MFEELIAQFRRKKEMAKAEEELLIKSGSKLIGKMASTAYSEIITALQIEGQKVKENYERGAD